MPRIDAPTVAEHHANVQTRLIDAAEQLMRAGRPITAQAVSEAAGIARNSIYRYVNGVADLSGLVVARYLPAWLAAVEEAMAAAPEPSGRIVAWVTSNLEHASLSGHGWLMRAARADGADLGDVASGHARMWSAVGAAWAQLIRDSGRSAVATALTIGLLDAAFRELDAGRPADLVIPLAGEAAAALAGALGSH